MRQDYVCAECGHEYEELGGGKCYVCGGSIVPIDEVGQEESKYPEDLLEEEGEGEKKPYLPDEEEIEEA